jgi:hypothetical protein
MADARPSTSSGVDVFFFPVGAHGAVAGWVARLYEAVVAARDRRPRRELFHAALEVSADGVTSSWIEMALPVHRCDRGVIAEGPVGARFLGRWRCFRYEVHRWTGDAIPDVSSAPAPPVRVSRSSEDAAHVLALVAEVPICTWGRDELDAGEMWNSNSLVAWLLASAGLRTEGLGPPPNGRVPGWDAGLRVAARSAGHRAP